MAKSRRKHRKVKGAPAGWKGCKCPAGSKKVSTCSKGRGVKVCRGRGWGCLGVGPSQKGKASPRFVKAICPGKLLPAGEPTRRLPAPRTGMFVSDAYEAVVTGSIPPGAVRA